MKKLIIICTIMVMVITMAMPCFATEELFPPLPKVDGDWIIAHNENGAYSAYCSTSFYDNGTAVMFNSAKRYLLTDGEWVFYETATNSGASKKWIDYDSTGTWATSDKSLFKNMPIEFSDFENVLSKAKEQFSVMTVVEVLAFIATACVGLAFMWWGVRKLTRAVMCAFKKGRVNL